MTLQTNLRIRNLTVAVGYSGHRYPFHPFLGDHYIEREPGQPVEELFTLTSSDYDMGDDMMACPCGEEIPRFATLGEMLEQAREHVRKMHGKVRK